MADFDPTAYQTFESLPAERRQLYKLPEDGAGFVEATAFDDPSAAYDEALIDVNTAASQELITELTTDYLDHIAAIAAGDLLKPVNQLAVEHMQRHHEALEMALATVDAYGSEVPELIRRYQVTTPIDMQFVTGLIDAASRQYKDREFGAADLEFTRISRLKQELQARHEVAEREVSITTPLSNERHLDLRLSDDYERLTVAIPMVVDYREVPVRLGPEAATIILGAPLTDEDYQAIAQTALGLPGEVGRRCNEYAEAATSWAQAKATGESSEQVERLVSQRRQTSDAVWSMFTESIDGPINGIVLDALFVCAIRAFPALANIESPQPFRD